MSIHSTMKSYKVTNFGAPLQEVIETVRVPKGSEVLLRVMTCGVCHSDLHLSDGHFDLGGGKQMDLSRTLQLPRTLGHEIVGEVVAVGESVSGLSVGSQWLVYPWIGCGQCSLCRAGRRGRIRRGVARGPSPAGQCRDVERGGHPHPRRARPGAVSQATVHPRRFRGRHVLLREPVAMP